MISEIYELYKKVKKWTRDDDLKAGCYKLLGTILINSKADFFSQNIETYFEDLFPKNKYKPFVYSCVLQLLRGNFFPDDLRNTLKKISGTFNKSVGYSSRTRPFVEEAKNVYEARIADIADRLFVKRKGYLGIENVDVCSDILVQMATQSLRFTLRVIIQLLSSTGIDDVAMFEELYVAVHALSDILNPTFSNSQHQEIGFSDLITRTVLEAEALLPNVFFACDSIVGSNTLGRSISILYPTNNYLTVSDKQDSNDDVYSNISKFIDSSVSQPPSPLVERRNREPSSTPFASVDIGLDKILSTNDDSSATMALNQKVQGVIKGWIDSCNKIENLPNESTPVMDAYQTNFPSLQRPLKSKVTASPLMQLKLFKELISLAKFIPTPELIGGQCFIGSLLVHSDLDIANEASSSLQFVFTKHPALRLGYFNLILES